MNVLKAPTRLSSIEEAKGLIGLAPTRHRNPKSKPPGLASSLIRKLKKYQNYFINNVEK